MCGSLVTDWEHTCNTVDMFTFWDTKPKIFLIFKDAPGASGLDRACLMYMYCIPRPNILGVSMET